MSTENLPDIFAALDSGVFPGSPPLRQRNQRHGLAMNQGLCRGRKRGGVWHCGVSAFLRAGIEHADRGNLIADVPRVNSLSPGIGLARKNWRDVADTVRTLLLAGSGKQRILGPNSYQTTRE